MGHWAFFLGQDVETSNVQRILVKKPIGKLALRKPKCRWEGGGGGTLWRNWLRHCATGRKVAGSIPDGVIGIFHGHNPSGRTIALG
jgi:hypothetical protein